MNSNMRNKLELLKLQQSEKLLAVCEITGLSITINLPPVTATMEYRNPLAEIKNIVSLLQKEEEVRKLPQDILAGMLLATLKRRNLIEGKLSSIEQNLILQECQQISLIKALLLFSRVTKEQGLILPRISLDSQLIVDSSQKGTNITNLVNSFMNSTNSILFPAQYLDSSRTIATTFTTSITTKVIREKTVLTSEVKATIKRLIAILKEENVAAPKLIEILNLSITGENLLGLMAKDGLGNKVIAALERYMTSTSLELAMSLKGIARNLTANDAAKQLFTKDLASVSDDSISKPRMSLKEIMALKTGKPLVAERSDAQSQQLSNLQQNNNNKIEVSEEDIDRLEALVTTTSPVIEETEELEEAMTVCLHIGAEQEALPALEEGENDNDL